MTPQSYRDVFLKILPWAVFLSLLTVGGLGAFGLWRNQVGRLRVETAVVTDQVHRRLECWIQDRLAIVEHFANQWPRRYQDSPEAFREDATAFIDLLPGFQAINWIDTDTVIQIVVPLEGNRAALGKKLSEHPSKEVRGAITRAAERRLPSRTSAFFELYQGGRGFTVYWPVVGENAELLGFVNGVFRLQRLVESCLAEDQLREGFRFSLFDANGQLTYWWGKPLTRGADLSATEVLEILDRPWTVMMAPSEEVMGNFSSALSWFLFVATFLVSGILSFLLNRILADRARLQRSERRVRLLLDSTVEGICGVDLSGKLIFCNASSLRLLGYESSHELMGQDVHELFHPHYPDGTPFPASECALYQAFRHGKPMDLTLQCLWKKTGEPLDVEIRIHPIERNGTVTGCVTTFIDVSARQQVAREREKLMAVLESTPDMVAILQGDGTPTYLNRSGRKMFGVEGEEELGPCLLNRFSSGLHQNPTGEALAMAQKHGVWQAEGVIEGHTGIELPVSLIVVAHGRMGGEVAYYSAIARDITRLRHAEKRRHALEEQFQQAQRMESLGVLAGGIAHDFNNLLVGILGHASLAASEVGPESPASISLRAIEKAAQRASELTRQLLAYSGRGQFVVESIDPRVVVEEMASLMRVSISKKVLLTFDFSHEAQPISGDTTQIRQVFLNLLTNASDAIGERSGGISLRVQPFHGRPDQREWRIFGESPPSGDFTYIEVSDTGSGMNE